MNVIGIKQPAVRSTIYFEINWRDLLNYFICNAMLSEVYSVVCILWGALRIVQCLICNALGDVHFYFVCYMVLVPLTA